MGKQAVRRAEVDMFRRVLLGGHPEDVLVTVLGTGHERGICSEERSANMGMCGKVRRVGQSYGEIGCEKRKEMNGV